MDSEDSPEFAEAFEWDDEAVERGNTAHIAGRNIYPYEVEEVYANGAPIYMNKASGTGEWLMIGTTDGDRALTIVMNYDSVRRCIRAFTGWSSTRSEIARRDRSSQ